MFILVGQSRAHISASKGFTAHPSISQLVDVRPVGWQVAAPAQISWLSPCVPSP